MLTQQIIDTITSQVYGNKLPLTYKTLSRNLKVNDKLARNLLEEYYDKYKADKSDLLPTYILIGTHKHSENLDDEGDYGEDSGSMLIKLCPLSDLEGSKKQFSELLSCSVYSLSTGDLSLGNIAVSNRTIEDGYTNEMCRVCGVIKTPTVGVLKGESVKAPVRSSKPAAPVKAEKAVKAEKNEKADPFAWYRAAKAKEAKEKAEKEPKKANKPMTYEPRKESKREHVVIDSGDDSVEIEESETKRARTSKEKEALAKMFDDDDDNDVEMLDSDDVKPLDAPEPEKPKDDLGEKIIDNFLNDDTTEEPVVKKEVKTYVDENGYTVAVNAKTAKKTKAKSKPEPKPKAATNHKISAKKAGKKQSSLMSFFGKKK